jgi:hypothetical protein
MGSLNAIAFADAVGDGSVTLRTALSWHLTANHFPPLPGAYADPLAAAIAFVKGGSVEALVALPEGIQPVPGRSFETDEGITVVRAADLVEACNAWAFIPEEDS